jgi:hypothetical protein
MMWSTATVVHLAAVPTRALAASALAAAKGAAANASVVAAAAALVSSVSDLDRNGGGSDAVTSQTASLKNVERSWRHALPLTLTAEEAATALTSAAASCPALQPRTLTPPDGAAAAGSPKAAQLAALPAPVAVSSATLAATHALPCFSPDGEWLAFCAMDRAGYEADSLRLWLYHLPTGTLMAPLPSLDVSLAELRFAPVVAPAEASAPPGTRYYVLVSQIDVLARHRPAIIVMRATAASASVTATAGVYLLDVPHSGSDVHAVAAVRAAVGTPGAAGGGGAVRLSLVFKASSMSAPPELHAADVTVPLLPPAPARGVEHPCPALLPLAAWTGEGGVSAPQPAFPDDALAGAPPPVSAGCLADLRVLPVTGLRPLTAFNDAVLSRTTMSVPREVWVPGARREAVHAFVLPPVGLPREEEDAPHQRGRWPVALLIHGGPQGNFNDSFHFRWNPQVYAAAGYTTIAINFHGSTSFGQAFTDSIRGDWGGAPAEDILAGLAYLLDRLPFADGTRVAALGASFGGYMVNWLNGNSPPGRFKCMVNHDGAFDTRVRGAACMARTQCACHATRARGAAGARITILCFRFRHSAMLPTHRPSTTPRRRSGSPSTTSLGPSTSGPKCMHAGTPRRTWPSG